MKKINEILKSARLDKNKSIADLEKITKIKSAFLDSIEKGEWERLPPFPIILGFVKSMASALGLDEGMAVAVLKRDYPPAVVRIAPKPDVATRFTWSPRLTFAIGVVSVILILIGYLVFQYVKFISPPYLLVESPKENQTVNSRTVSVFGITDSDAKITVNNQPVEVFDDGRFSVHLDIVPETKDITIVASSRSGKTTTISRKINVSQ